MRLIDKDLVLKTAKDKEWGLWCEIVNIKFAPEVNAIPVEWITNWLAKQTVPATSYGLDCSAIHKMLDDWEKENVAD